MDQAPLPPHERSWRHPSELTPTPHEPTTASGRLLIATSATLSLLLVGLLAVSMTPRRSPAPVAASSTSGQAARTAPASITRASLPVVTPVGDDGWAVTTMDAVAGRTGPIEAQLPSGVLVEVEVVGRARSGEVVVVALPASNLTEGLRLATASASPSDTVLVGAAEPFVVVMEELVDINVEEGTPVLDEDGELLGLCTADDHNGTALITVGTMPMGSSTPDHGTVAVTSTSAASDVTAPAGPAGSNPDRSDPDENVPDRTGPVSTISMGDVPWPDVSGDDGASGGSD